MSLGGAAFLLAALWFWRSSLEEAAPGERRVAAPPPATGAETLSSTPLRRPITETPFADLPEPIRHFFESTPYPSSSGRLTRAHEDLLHPNQRYERHRPIPDTLSDDPASVVSWRFTTDRWAYVGPETVHASLEVRRGGAPIAVDVVHAFALREGASGTFGSAEPLTFEREGDHLVADLPLARFADHFGPITLEVRFEYDRGRFHEDRLRIESTPASHVPGRVTEMSDRLSNGSLLLEVGADLAVAGFYRFDANVYDANGNPVAFTSWKGDLAAGPQRIPLEVWGKVLTDAGIPGPWTVGEIRGYRFLDGQYPDREWLPPTPGTHTTRAWPLDGFTDASYVDAHEVQMAERMLDDLAAGRPLLAPPAAIDPVASRPADDDAEPTLVR